MKLSIVIPAYNEAERIRPTLEAYTGHFVPHYGDDVEFLVVVNASTDGTEKVVEEYRLRHPQVRTIIEPRRVGKGGALILGFKQATGELVGFVDADGSTPPAAFQALVDHLGGAAGIIASRWRKESVVSPRQPLSRRMASRVFNGLVRLLFKLKFTDTQCGAKLFRREALERVLPRLGLTRWAFDVDLLFQLRREHLTVIEWPTTWQDVAGSKLDVSRASMEMMLAIGRLRLLHSPFRWVVEVYNKTLGRHVH